MKKYIFILAVAVLLSGCGKTNNLSDSQNNMNNNQDNGQTAGQNANIQVPGSDIQPEQGTPVQYTLADVAQHNQASDCWTVANAKVYNVTSFVNKHPGGEAILQGCGKDMTEFFNTKHAKQSKELLPSFYIGDLKQ